MSKKKAKKGGQYSQNETRAQVCHKKKSKKERKTENVGGGGVGEGKDETKKELGRVG